MKSSALHVLIRLLAVILVALTPAEALAAPGTVRRPAGPPDAQLELRADTFGLPLQQDAVTALYAKPAVYLQRGEALRVRFSVAAAGDYVLHLDMVAGQALISTPEGELTIDGAPLPEAPRIVFPVYYENSAATFPLNRYGNETLIRQRQLQRWTTLAVRDTNLSQKEPLAVPLSAGEHTLALTVTRESLYVGSLYLRAPQPAPAYADYRAAAPAVTAAPLLLTLEAETPAFKNDTAIRPVNNRSLSVTPYDTYRLLLNALGGEQWRQSGSAVYYRFTVPQAGFYEITLRVLQNTRDAFVAFRRITLDGAVPFAEFEAMPFPYTREWINLTLGGEMPYQLYLTPGEHILGLEATHVPYAPLIAHIQSGLHDINALALEIKRLTGNQVDLYKEWVISDYIPDIRPRLQTLIAALRADEAQLAAICGQPSSPELLMYRMAIENLEFLAQDPDKIPLYMNRLSEGSGSAAQLLSNLQAALEQQPLTLDKLFIHTLDQTPPAPQAAQLRAAGEEFKRFVRSFTPSPYETLAAAEDELEVWVNRPRQYVDLLQTLADENFTPASGIRVKFSIMPDESKLVLANAAGIQPDVALGVSTNVPYELAIRNALKDLRTFEDFDTFIRIYSPGALLSYIINDSVYAIPETQDFWVTFYRRDIMEALGLPIPHTWPEVIEILPELQRYGMNFNTPLSSGSGLKGYLITAPYLFNYDARLYSADGFASGLSSDEAINAVRFMAESFTIYGMPLTTASFYQSFRDGSLPIGVSNFETYLKLMTAAPEIRGQWAIDLYPATVLPDGRQLRYATGSAQACFMFANTEKPQEAWEFLKWWMSTPTQVEFQQQIVLNYGLEYLWNSANVEAFRYLPIPDEHKAVILEQWQWLQEPVRLPGSYMQERELSNAWNRIVFDGVNPRVALDNAILIINREITRKMEEFGYLQNGQKVKEFRVPTLETVEGWMQNAR